MATRICNHICPVAVRFQAKNQNKNTTPKIPSTTHAKGGQAMTINARASQAATFRTRKGQRRVNHGEIAIITSNRPAPG